MTTLVETKPTQNLEPFKGVKKVPHAEYYTSGHRTCEGCESAQIMSHPRRAGCPGRGSQSREFTKACMTQLGGRC